MKQNFLISTGGSGGHVIPAIILYEHLKKDAKLIITTDKRGLKYIDKENFNIEVIDTPKLNNFFFLPYNLFKVLYLTLRSFHIMKINKIDKIFSTGGYMSLPLVLAARILKLNIYLVEPNHILGRANKFFLKSCRIIFCYTEKIKNFPEKFKHKKMIISPLVKKFIYDYKLVSNTKDRFTILIVGGSQGAKIFDENLKNSIVNISKDNSIEIIQQTNEENISKLKNFYTKNNVKNEIFNFDKNFINIIKQADLCITRAGASTLAELSVLNIPFIAVPLPTSKDNHQFENANYYHMNKCCWIIEQKHFNEKIEKLLREIIKNKNDFLKKKENLNKLNYQNTWDNVNQKILKAINEN